MFLECFYVEVEQNFATSFSGSVGAIRRASAPAVFKKFRYQQQQETKKHEDTFLNIYFYMYLFCYIDI